jgi:flagellar basal-body rod modification protein FlgD
MQQRAGQESSQQSQPGERTREPAVGWLQTGNPMPVRTGRGLRWTPSERETPTSTRQHHRPHWAAGFRSWHEAGNRAGGMMAAAAGFWNHHMAAGAAVDRNQRRFWQARPVRIHRIGNAAGTSGTTGSTGSTGTGDDSSTISSNDFLTLLVTEMKNQDPTSDQDPNEYINQLVQVNSLEQLIDINQNLTTALGGAGGATGGGTGTPGSAAGQSSGAAPGVQGLTAQNALSQIQGAARAKAGAMAGAQPLGSSATGSDPAATFAARLRHAPGNLAVPQANPAADHVAHALDGQSRKQSIGTRLPGNQ